MKMYAKITVDGYPYNFDQHDTPGTVTFKGQRKLQRDAVRKRPLLRGSKRWKQEMRGMRPVDAQ
jgi:hypothetical protein